MRRVHQGSSGAESQFNHQWWLGLGCAIAVGVEVLYILNKGTGAFSLPQPALPAPTAGNTEMIANALFRDYLLPFEIASLLLLVAVVGLVVMAKKRI